MKNSHASRRWSPLEAEGEGRPPARANRREGYSSEGTQSVWSVILYSEMRFTIPPLSSDQSHRGFPPGLPPPRPQSCTRCRRRLWRLMEGDTSLATPLPNTGQLKMLKTDWESLKIYRPEVNTMSRAARDLQGFFLFSFFFFSETGYGPKKKKRTKQTTVQQAATHWDSFPPRDLILTLCCLTVRIEFKAKAPDRAVQNSLARTLVSQHATREDKGDIHPHCTTMLCIMTAGPLALRDLSYTLPPRFNVKYCLEKQWACTDSPNKCHIDSPLALVGRIVNLSAVSLTMIYRPDIGKWSKP